MRNNSKLEDKCIYCNAEIKSRQYYKKRYCSARCIALQRYISKEIQIGTKFGKLTVQSLHSSNGGRKYLCVCECKKTSIVRSSNLQKKNGTKSCGCLQRQALSNITKTHGMSDTPEYRVWCSIRERCTNISNTAYPDYGGRGIRVYKLWLYSFDSFYRHVGAKPSEEHSLDRINNDGNYEPGNVRWATKQEQANNRRQRIRDVSLISPDGNVYVVNGATQFAKQHSLGKGSVLRLIHGETQKSRNGWKLKK